MFGGEADAVDGGGVRLDVAAFPRNVVAVSPLKEVLVLGAVVLVVVGAVVLVVVGAPIAGAAHPTTRPAITRAAPTSLALVPSTRMIFPPKQHSRDVTTDGDLERTRNGPDRRTGTRAR